MDRTERIFIRVTPDEKERIEQAADDDPDVSSVSGYIRAAVRTYEAEDNEASVNTDNLVEAVELGLSPVQEELEQIQNRLASLEADAEQPDDEISRIAQEITAELPVHANASELPDLARDIPSTIEEGTRRAARFLSNPEAWANYYEYDVTKVRKALALAHTWYPEVEYAEVNDTRRWYKTRELHNHGE